MEESEFQKMLDPAERTGQELLDFLLEQAMTVKESPELLARLTEAQARRVWKILSNESRATSFDGMDLLSNWRKATGNSTNPTMVSKLEDGPFI